MSVALAEPFEARRKAVGPAQGRALVVGGPSETNLALGRALAKRGFTSGIAAPFEAAAASPAELVLGRLDVLPTLDRVEPGLWVLSRLEQQDFNDSYGRDVFDAAAAALVDRYATISG